MSSRSIRKANSTMANIQNRGGRRVGVRDVARRAGVAKSTAAYVLSSTSTHKISEATEKKVLAAARELGYVPNRMAAGLKTGRSGLIGVFFGSMQPLHMYFTEMFAGITNACMRHDVFPVMLFQGQASTQADEQRIERLYHAGIDGLVACRPDPSTVAQLDKLAGDGMPMACVFGDQESGGLLNVDVDNRLIGVLSAEFLLSRGYRKIVALIEADDDSPVLARETGFREVMLREGLDPRVVELPSRGSSGSLSQWHVDCMEQISGLDGDAILALSAGTTFLCSYVITESRDWTPKRWALVGVDVPRTPNSIPITHYTASWQDIGQRAIDAICDSLKGATRFDASRLLLPPQRVDGDTCPASGVR